MGDKGNSNPLTTPLPDGMTSNQVNESVSSLVNANQRPENQNDLNGRPKDPKKETKKKVYIAPQAKLKEILDGIGHFVRVPPKDASAYPSRAKVKSRLKQLHGTFSVSKGFDRIVYIDACDYNLISKKYVKKLCSWLKKKSNDPSIDLTVDNSNLGHEEEETLLTRRFSDESAVISRECWEQLIEWFGGGISIGVKCIRNQVYSGKLIRVVCGDDNSHFRRFFFNLYETVESVKREICEVFGVDPKLARLHDYFSGKPFNRIDSERSLVLPLSSGSKLVHNNLCYLEVKAEGEDFSIKYLPKNTRGYVPTDYNSNHYDWVGTGARNYRNGYSSQSGSNYFSPYAYQRTGYGYGAAAVDTISGARRQVKGVTGLNNLGNTCYMNSIIQCLSNTFLIKEPFLSKTYEADINTTNVLGYKGEVAKAFQNVMRLMWSGDGNTVRPAGFKKAITDAKQEFRGFQQHDSQEFLSQLLDALHEDLNRVVEKPITTNVEAKGRADAVVAAESLNNYKMRNDSVITDQFSGLFKSTVTCPDTTCGNVSVTFDPYMILPLPLQATETSYRVLQIVFVPINPEVKPFQTEVIVPKHGPVYLLRESIKDRVGITNLNIAESNKVRKGKKLKASDNPNVTLALGYAENDEEVVGKRDILIFHFEGKCLDPIPVANTADLDIFSKDKSLICYETRDYVSFENKLVEPEKSWDRELNYPRQQGGVTGQKIAEGDRYKIGSRACPFLLNDVWHGRYNHVADEQHLRIEILGVEQINWEEYSAYTAEVISKYGPDNRDVQLDEKEFAKRQVFLIKAEADSMENTKTEKIYGGNKDETQFDLKGVYITSVDQETELIDIYKTFTEAQKKKNKKKTKNVDGEGMQGSLEAFANSLASDVIEKKYLQGFFVLRPQQRKILRSRFATFKDDDTSREPIILQGSVDHSFKYIWGQFQVDMHFVKGQFICQRYESSNWDSRLVENGRPATDTEVKNWTAFPETLSDSRILVLLSHKVRGNITSLHAGIPEAFFIPKNITESGLMEMLKARFRIYFETEFKLTGASIKEVNEQTGVEMDAIEQRLQRLVVKRASTKFETSNFSSFTDRTNYLMGREIDAHEDLEAGRSADPCLLLVCEWDIYPFLEARPESVFTKLSNTNEEKMTLHKALDLFSKTDRLSNRNTWYCNKCKAHKRAYKQLQLWSVPKVLVVQFKRFSQNETRMRADKLDIAVEFPFNVDLTNYTLCSKTPGSSAQADIEATNQELDYNYELVAISSHMGGGLGSGHYVACGKNENDGHWYKFNDSIVSKIDDDNISEIVNPEAYVLFYVRKSEIEARKLILEQRKLEAEANPEPEPERVNTTEAVGNEPQDIRHPQPNSTNEQRTVKPVDLPARPNPAQPPSEQIARGAEIFKFALEQEQIEIRDNNGHFKTMPSKDPSTYPTRDEVLAQITEIYDRFTVRAGFKVMPFRHNQFYYLISMKYVTKLQNWLQRKENTDGLDLTVDNSSLGKFGEETFIRERIKANSDYQRVNVEGWNKLIEWFGGGPSIKMKQLHKKAAKGKLIRVFCGNQSRHFRRFYFNELELLSNIKNEVCQAFGVDPQGSRFYDYFNNLPITRLDTPDKLKSPLHKERMLTNNACYLELRNQDGLFTIPLLHNEEKQRKSIWGRGGKTQSRNTTMEYSRGADFYSDKLIGGTSGMGYGIKGLVSDNDTLAYVSSILQCFANTRFFKQFFITEVYKTDINETNHLGFRGKIAEAFHNIMKLFDDSKGTIVKPIGFERALKLAKLNRSDAKNFLPEFVDALHEDLNRVVQKPITERVEANGRSDAVVARESIDSYRSRDNSIVTDLLTGFLKSTITCPSNACGNVAVSFDPFRVLSLPLKAGATSYKKVQVVFVPANPEEQPTQIEVTVPENGPLFMLTEAVKAKLGINQMNQQDLKRHNKKKPLSFNKNETISAAIGFNDASIAGKRDIMVFGCDNSKLSKAHFSSTAKVKEVMKCKTIVCYETFNFFSYEEKNLDDSKYWSQNLLFQNDGSESDSIKQVPEENKMQVGFPTCPFLLGDEWYARYEHSRTQRVIRLEIVEVTKMSWTDYPKYTAHIINANGPRNVDMMLKEADFLAGTVFQIRAKVDSTQVSSISSRGGNKSQFDLYGVYIVGEANASKDTNLLPGDLEKELTHGSFVLRPSGPQKATRQRGSSRNNTSMLPIILHGSIDPKYKYMWGTYQTPQANISGQFIGTRHKSMNWDSALINKKAPVVKNWTSSPQKPFDNRALVLLCHKGGKFAPPSGIPDAFLVPAEITEGEILVMIRARFRLYFELEFKLAGATNDVTVDPKTGEKIDEIEQRLNDLKIERSTESFGKKQFGQQIKPGGKSRLTTCSVIHLICESMFYPFMESRPQTILNTIDTTSSASKITLHQSLDMLSQPRHLSEMEAWYCNKCKKHQQAYKQQQIWSLPTILIVQFDRYIEGPAGSMTKKIETPVDFPIDIDFSPFTLCTKVKGKSAKKDIEKTNKQLDLNYELIAVTSCETKIYKDHYVACAKNEHTGCWYKYNDSLVTKVSLDNIYNVVNPQAYNLFYIRKSDLK